jgi:hypothetical protein
MIMPAPRPLSLAPSLAVLCSSSGWPLYQTMGGIFDDDIKRSPFAEAHKARTSHTLTRMHASVKRLSSMHHARARTHARMR